MTELLWMLLPVAMASGWWMARRTDTEATAQHQGSTEYFRGLNYLLEDKPDEAIAVFVKMVELDHDTAETHLTLGNLFRRRGEVDRALHIHRSLIDRESLTPEQYGRTKQALAEDYLRAGLFDRAENLFSELVEDPDHAVRALTRLVDIYEQEREWPQAIAACNKLQQLDSKNLNHQIAHFYCELAELARKNGDESTASTNLDHAMRTDPVCARANMLRGKFAMEAGELDAAITSFKSLEENSPGYFPEVVAMLEECHERLDRRSEWLDYLREVLKRNHSGRVTGVLAKALQTQAGDAAALAFLEEELPKHPSILGLQRFLELKLDSSEGSTRADLGALYRISEHLLKDATRYRCDNCGFIGNSLYWRCPGCKNWNSVKPVGDLILRNVA